MSLKHTIQNSDHHPSSAKFYRTATHHHHHIVKEHMFEKRLTPSDVGKLNRLVIPKQFAEKYLPHVSSAAGSLLLSFTDESGKPWKFRYSYWNSSQSYVLTKGWSRFVKEKKLDAGDVAVFQRQIVNGHATAIMFIGWRRPSNNRQPVSSFNTETKRDVKCKTLRLFGVNMECTTQEHEESITCIRHHRHDG